MRYRALDANGDYTFGQGSDNFLVDNPACVAQAVKTGLLLWQGEWYLDTTAGMAWGTQVLGSGTQSLYDQAIKAKILSVQGVKDIVSYSSSLNTANRVLTVDCTVDTIYGIANVGVNLSTAGGYGVGPYGERPYGT